MSKTAIHQVLPGALASFDGEPASYRRVFEAIAQQVSCARVLLISTFPRGGTQILQPSGLPEGLVRAYGKGLLASDGPTWQAILRNAPVVDDDCFPVADSLQSSAYYRELMEPTGLAHVAAAPLPGPTFLGYPAALHLYRQVDEPAFSAEDLRRLGQAAQQLGRAVETLRDVRVRNACGVRPVWEHVTCCRQFIFDRQGRQVPLYQHRKPMPPGVDEELRGEIRKLVSQCLESVNGEHVQSDRAELTDGHGEVWAFRAIVHREFPALGAGPYVFLCLQPSACEWQTVRQGDFAADPELARLVPTLRFMQQEFHRSPTLDEIAEKAHLSPFHFHRRFTELLGLTPKHFLLACQIQQAKRMLMERKHALANIASECGFAHQSHFTSRFKQATGLTPTRWRRFATDLENGVRQGGERAAAEAQAAAAGAGGTT
jgi:AraC-like DNA-binding protein